MYVDAPIDSTDARERREAEKAAAEAAELARAQHAQECWSGWLGTDADERPIPCPRCRPWLTYVACRMCSAPWQSCEHLRAIRRGPCCDACGHGPRPDRAGS